MMMELFLLEYCGCDVVHLLIYLLMVLILFLIVLTTYLRYSNNNTRNYSVEKCSKKKLPGPCSLPLIGSLLEIGWIGRNCKNDNEFCKKVCKKYGPVTEFKVGVQKFVLIEDFDVARHIFNSEDWCSRLPSTPMFLEYFVHKQKIGILLNDGDDYKETRRFTLRCLKEFGFGQLQNLGNVIQEEIEHFIHDLESGTLFKNDNNNKNNNDNDENNNYSTLRTNLEDITLHFLFNLPSLNILWKYLCGTRFSCDDVFMSRVVGAIQRASECVNYMSNPMYAFPWLRFIPGATPQQLLVELFTELRSIFQEVVTQKRKIGTYKSNPADFIEMYLKHIDEAQSNQPNDNVFTEDQLIQSCVDMTLAGSDTTGNSIEYSILYMLQFPEIQERVHQEIESIIGFQRRPSIEDRRQMPFTEATILEIIRCANVAAFDYRTALCDTELGEGVTQKGTMALLNIAQMHNLKDMWGDPEIFRPERFLNSDMEIINVNKLYAFGGGKRLCIGKSMAKATLFIFFTTMLQRYKFEPSAKYPDFSIHSFSGGFTTRPDQFYCTIKLRKPFN